MPTISCVARPSDAVLHAVAAVGAGKRSHKYSSVRFAASLSATSIDPHSRQMRTLSVRPLLCAMRAAAHGLVHVGVAASMLSTMAVEVVERQRSDRRWQREVGARVMDY